MKKTDRAWIWGLVFVAFLGVLSVAVLYDCSAATYREARYARIRSQNVSVEGQVIGIDEHYSGGPRSRPELRVSLEFTPGGRSAPVRGDVTVRPSPVTLVRLQAGSAIRIYYDPSDPTRMAIDD